MQIITITVSAIISWALLSVVSRILLVNFDLDPWLFSFLQLVSGGLTLLLIGYRGAGGANSFARPSTWVLGALRVLSAALYTAVLAIISVLETGIISALNLPVVAVFVWVLHKQRPSAIAWVGHAILLVVVTVMARRLESDLQLTVLGLMGLNAMCLAAMNLIAEQHPENKTATLSGRAWFTGVVLAITAAMFLCLRILQGQEILTQITIPLILSSVIVGMFLRAPSMFLAFWAVSNAGAQGYTAAISLLPLFGMMFEQAAVAVGLLDTSRFQVESLYLALVALAGTLLIWFSGQAFVQKK